MTNTATNETVSIEVVDERDPERMSVAMRVEYLEPNGEWFKAGTCNTVKGARRYIRSLTTGFGLVRFPGFANSKQWRIRIYSY